MWFKQVTYAHSLKDRGEFYFEGKGRSDMTVIGTGGLVGYSRLLSFLFRFVGFAILTGFVGVVDRQGWDEKKWL